MSPPCGSGGSIANNKPTKKNLLVLDTDHFSELERNLAPGKRLAALLRATRREKALTVVTIEEQMRGWLAEINRFSDPERQIMPYAQLSRQVESLSKWTILPWDEESSAMILRFRRERVRIGTLDLKIACIVMAHDATLLTRNLADFAQVPGLRAENWLE